MFRTLVQTISRTRFQERLAWAHGTHTVARRSDDVRESLTQTTSWVWSLLLLVMVFVTHTGCQTLSLPAIDPTGNRIFSNQTTSIINPHDPNNGYPSTQPAFQAPPNPPKCLASPDGSPNGMCKGCLAGTGCLGRKKEQLEEIRGRCGQLLLTPTRIVAPVGGEVILLAGVCGKDDYLVTNEPIEWMLDPNGVGQFVEVGDDAKGRRQSHWKKETGPKVEKLDVDFARGRTSREPGVITRGTATRDDDLPIRKGQTWISLTSPSEGVSNVTVLAPDSDVWDQRRQTAKIYWVDANWVFPQPQYAPSGEIVRLITHVRRSEGFVPAEGWRVRYKLVQPEVARFIPDNAAMGTTLSPDGTSATTRVNADGAAIVDIVSNPGIRNGTAFIEIEVARPSSDGMPELPIANGTTSVTWNAPNLVLQAFGPEVGVPGQPLSYTAVLSNIGDLTAENVILRAALPAGMAMQSASFQPDEPVNGIYSWRIGPVEPRKKFEVNLVLVAQAESDSRIVFEAVGSPNLNQSSEVRTLIQNSKVAFQMQPAENSAQVEVGNQATFKMLVTNTGNQTINDLSIFLESDPGLQHASSGDNRLQMNVGFLSPGNSREFIANFIVQREGQLCVKGTVVAANQPIANQTVCTRGLQAAPKRPGIGIDVETDLSQTVLPLGSKPTLRWSVRNTGQVPLRRGVISLRYDPAFKPLNATERVVASPQEPLLEWRFEDLPIGQVLGSFAVELEAINVSRQATMTISVRTEDGITDSRAITFEIVGPGEVRPTSNRTRIHDASSGDTKSTEVLSRSERLEVSLEPVNNAARSGSVATYRVLIDNQRNLPDQKVTLHLNLPEGMSIQSVKGPVTQYQLADKNRRAHFAPIQFMRAKEQIELTIEVKYTGTSSLSELRAFVTSNNQREPLVSNADISLAR